MYTLYYAPGACSLAVQIKLQAIAVHYHRISINLKQRQHQTEAFTRLNPNQRVPVLELNGEYYTETMALLLFLEQRHPQGLLPEHAPLLARVLQKMNWLSNTLQVDFAMLWRPVHYSQNEDVQQQLSGEAQVRLLQHFADIDKELCDTTFWLSEQLTLADYYLLPFLRWGNKAFSEVAALTGIQRYLAGMATLTEVKAALEVEAISL